MHARDSRAPSVGATSTLPLRARATGPQSSPSCLLAAASIVVATALLGRLGPARGLAHDDLVDAQHGDRRLGGELDRLLLRVQEVKDAAIARAALDNVDAD